MTVVKGVRFRVEFSRSSGMQTTSTSGGYNTLVSLVQEKGAQSSFRGEFRDHYKVFPNHADPILGVFAQLKQAIEAETPSPKSNTLPSAMRSGSGQGQSQGSSHLSAPPVRYTNSAPNTPVMPTTPRFANQQSPGGGGIRF
jgi:serine/threonine-protein kinase HSL1 (negative regulator of Swe1 kinase)